MSPKIRWIGAISGTLGVGLMVLVHWMVFFWVPTEQTQGVVQRIFLTGPLWGRVAWGAWWVWDPKLTLTLLLWFIYLGYFLVRASTDNSERGKRFSAVLGIVGALDIPLIYFSVVWFRSMHPGAVVMREGGPSIEPEMLATLLTGLGSATLIFIALFLFRYRLERVKQALVFREMVAERHPPVP